MTRPVHQGAMSAPREHVVGQILALGTDEVPFTFTPSADGVTGVWHYADARWVGFVSAGTIDREMEAPVRQVLEQAGWTPRRRGFWDRLTGRG